MPQSSRVSAAVVMVAGASLVSLNEGVALIISKAVGVPMAVWARYVFCLAILLATTGLRPVLRTFAQSEHRWFQVLRASMPILGSVFFVKGMATIPLSEGQGIVFLAPVLVLLGARLFLKEEVGPRRAFGAALAFVGVMLIASPDLKGFGWSHLYPLGTAITFAIYQLMTRMMGLRSHALNSMHYLAVIGFLLTTPFAGATWQFPDLSVWMLMGLSGLLYCMSHFSFVWALSRAEASFLAPFLNAQLVSAVVVGQFLLGQQATLTAIGGCCLIVAGSVIASRKSR